MGWVLGSEGGSLTRVENWLVFEKATDESESRNKNCEVFDEIKRK